MSKQRMGTCWHCGKYTHITSGHVISKGLFPKPRPNLPVLDECHSCNKIYAQFEADFMLDLSATASVSSTPLNLYISKVRNGISINNSSNLILPSCYGRNLKKLKSRVTTLPVVFNGLVVGTRSILTFSPSTNYILMKYAAGLHFLHLKNKPNMMNAYVKFWQYFFGTPYQNAQIFNLATASEVFYSAQCYKKQKYFNQDFNYQGWISPTGGSIWWMWFYGSNLAMVAFK